MNDETHDDTRGLRTLRVFVAGWVIGDGSFPHAAIGDTVDVSLDFYPADANPSPSAETRTAKARPAYGRSPKIGRDGGILWLHLLYGDGWSSQWWADRPVRGTITVTGHFSVDLEDGRGQDNPGLVHGRVRRLHLVERRVEPLDNGWKQVSGSDRLSERHTFPTEVDYWPDESTRDGDFVAAGVLVELDLNAGVDTPPAFTARAIAVHDDIVWVMHASDPVLLRVDATAGDSPMIVRYTLPLPIEESSDPWTRRVHIDGNGGCWITSPHDIHRCTVKGSGEMDLDRFAPAGGRATALHLGNVYVVGQTEEFMSSARRHGLVRTEPDLHRLQVLDQIARQLVPITDSNLERTVRVAATRADRAVAGDGTRWSVDGSERIRRIDGRTGDAYTVDLSGPSEPAVVNVVTPSVWTDPVNADIVAAITVDTSHLRAAPPDSVDERTDE